MIILKILCSEEEWLFVFVEISALAGTDELEVLLTVSLVYNVLFEELSAVLFVLL
jgi:hypothetical protein